MVFACHGDQVLPLLADPTDAEREVFRHFTTTANEAWLHTDAAALPAAPRAHASWNYRLGGDGRRAADGDLPSQPAPGDSPAPPTTASRSTRGRPIADDRVIRRIAYRHPR